MFLRHAGGDGMEVSESQRTVTGLIAPYDKPTEVNDGWGMYRESFAPGAFAEAFKNPRAIKFLAQHDQRAMPLGACTDMEDTPQGPVATFKVSKTRAGDEYLELARDGAVDGLSVGFVPVTPGPAHFAKRGEHVVRTAVKLREVSGVTWPAYADARLSGVRSELLGLELARLGKEHSAATIGKLQGVLDLLASADDGLDEALEKLSALMGVENPDKPETGDEETTDDESAGRGMSLALAQRRMRLRAYTSSTRRAESAAQYRKGM